ncbi:MAG: serine hydrolase domain-containing protein, partial [Ramlibacter sp.]
MLPTSGFCISLGLLAVLLSLAGTVQAQEASMATEPLALARAALGALPGQAVAGVWREGRASVAGVRRAPGAQEALPLPEEEVSGKTATLYEIGSITKVFTGVLLAQAVEAGELSLDDTLGRLLEGKAQIESPHVAAVTLRQLVTHTACLPRQPADFRQGSKPDDPYRDYNRARLWQAVAALQLPAAPPCEALYSNFGMALVAEILSERAGKPWAQLARERITVPLRMHDTLQVLGDKAQRLAPAFAGDRSTPPWEMQAFAGVGALRATPHDLLVFGRAIAAGGSGPLGAAAARLVTPLA